MFRFLKVTRTRLGDRARALLLQIRGYGAEGGDDAAEAQDDVELVQPFGLFARAVIADGLEALAVEIGDSTLGLALINKALSTLDVEEGETRLYGAKESSCRVRLRADGSMDIEAKSGAAIRITTAGGGNIVLNGGTLDVARKTDTVSPTAAMTTWMSQVATAINALAPGSVAPPSPATFATITGGNATVKA
jgi:hypothetical protein